MPKPFIVKYWILFFIISISCVRQISPPIRQSAPILVVEGMITTDTAPYTAKLSFTGKFTNASASVDSDENYINDAVVIIKDDAGDSTICPLVGYGTYQSSDLNFIGTVGRSYTLQIRLGTGKSYVSAPEKIMPVSPIDNLSVIYDSTYVTDVRPTQFIISANTHYPPDLQNYYRWSASGYTPRKSWGEPCNPYFDSPCTNPFMCICFADCEQLLDENQINILSDQFINGNEIIQPVFYDPIYWFGNHFIEIRQYSLSQDGYIFWEQYLQQTARTGTILDPLPASLIGNIHNSEDSSDVALGYFEASAFDSKKLNIEPSFLQQYFLESVAGQYIPQGDCHQAFPNSLEDDAIPSGWDNAEVIQLH
jgi:hypothetical protein